MNAYLGRGANIWRKYNKQAFYVIASTLFSSSQSVSREVVTLITRICYGAILQLLGAFYLFVCIVRANKLSVVITLMAFDTIRACLLDLVAKCRH